MPFFTPISLICYTAGVKAEGGGRIQDKSCLRGEKNREQGPGSRVNDQLTVASLQALMTQDT